MAATRAGRKIIVEFPQSLYIETEKATSELSMSRSALIRSAVREYLDKRRIQELEKELADGYLANASQARETAEAFANVDSELL
jgi:metal-responsive CopG/Arc/MetJ family transcriptional regulator